MQRFSVDWELLFDNLGWGSGTGSRSLDRRVEVREDHLILEGERRSVGAT